MRNDIVKIANMLKDNRFDESIMSDILVHYRDSPPVIHIRLQKGSKILRSTINNEPGLFDNVPRLSYPPSDKARTDRASLQGKPMFYGSIFTSAAQESNAYPKLVSAMETTDILRKYDEEGKVLLTISLWKPKRELSLMAFPFCKALKKPCKEIVGFQNAWDMELSKRYSVYATRFSEYIGDKISKKKYSCLYEITAHTIQYLLYNSVEAEQLDGVVFPSVWCDGQGMNICLKKEVVDECIDFQGAQVQLLDKIKGEATMFPVADSQISSEGMLEWTLNRDFLKLLGSDGIQKLYREGLLKII